MKFAIILFTSLLLFTACGSGGGQETSDPALVALQLAESVDEQLGADNGFNAIIYAWERGYSNSQLFNAIDHTRLLGNGFLATLVSGYQVPAGPALGLVLLPEEAHHHFRSVAFISLEDASAIRRIAAGTRAVDKVPVGQGVGGRQQCDARSPAKEGVHCCPLSANSKPRLFSGTNYRGHTLRRHG